MKASPFPGMDPFLENPAQWSSVHTRLITIISDQLNEQIAPNYYAEIEQRIYIVTEEVKRARTIVPDVYITEMPESEVSTSSLAPVAAISPATIVEPQYDLQIRDRFLEIRDTQNHQVVTVIEILPTFNKTPRMEGFEAFQKKREGTMGTQVHWLEIDLLRAGRRPLEVAGESDYYALLHRAGHSNFAVWYSDIRDPLPTIAVPLNPPHPDAPLDLQKAVNELYRRGYYSERIDYDSDLPLPRLTRANQTWLHNRIKHWQAIAL